MAILASIGLALVGGLWAPNADIPLIEAAVAQVKAGRPVEALRILNPIQESRARLSALSADDQLLLFYTLGRAQEEGGQPCLAWSAFDRARRTRRLRGAEKTRIEAAVARVAGQRDARLRVECAGKATILGRADVGGRAEQCPFEVSGLDPAVPVQVQFEVGGMPFKPVDVTLERCETSKAVMPPAGTLTLSGAAEARIGGQTYDLPTTIQVPPGRYSVLANGREHLVKVAAGRTRVVDLAGDLSADSPASTGGSAWPWIATGIAGAAAVVTGSLALARGAEHAALQDDVNAGRSKDRAGVLALEDETNQYAITSGALSLVAAGCLVWALWPADDATAFVVPGGVGWRF